MKKCNFCNHTFSTRQSLSIHLKTCIFRSKPVIKRKTNPTVQKIEQIQNASDNAEIKELLREIKTEIINRPAPIVINNINNNVTITQKLPKCFYEALVQKIGTQGIADMFDQNRESTELDALTIYKKLYPSNKIEDNPVVFHDNHFKYLNDNNEVVVDDNIIRVIARKIQNALLHASNMLITESIKLNTTNKLYDVYNIGEIQNNIRDMDQMQDQISDYIASLSPN